MSLSVVLLIEDDVTIGENLSRAFEEHFTPRWVQTGSAGIAAAQDVDLVVLDLGLPDLDGLDVCRHINQRWPNLPVVILTARQDEVQIVAGLEAGAVDYITKPFRLAEVIARVRAHLRTVRTSEPESQPPAGAAALEIGALRVDAAARRVFVRGIEVTLRPKELDVLLVLIARAGTVVSRDELMRQVWDENWYGSTKTLDVHMASLRRALRGDGDAPCTITTLRGVGFRMEQP